MINLKWVGPLGDSSGYGSASRNYVRALLDSKQVELTVSAVSFEEQKTSHGDFEQLIKPYFDKPLDCKIQVTHLTPENYPAVKGRGVYNIGYTVWETDKIPDKWIDLCNCMDELWVPSTWNKEVFARSGVTKPITVIPHVIEPFDLSQAKHVSFGVDDDCFVFYSIFQWIERKNPLGLLKAYLTEFDPDENVCLALKSYRLNTSPKEQNIIKEDIKNLKLALQLKEYPQIRFFGTLLPMEYMVGFHQRGNCFVLPHHAEGFGIPMAEAMALGKPTISTNYSGNVDFMNEENSYLIDYQLEPVSHMIFPNYNGKMTWAEPSIDHLKKLMRYVYSAQDKAAEKGYQGKQYILNNLNRGKVASLITSRLEEIQKGL